MKFLQKFGMILWLVFIMTISLSFAMKQSTSEIPLYTENFGYEMKLSQSAIEKEGHVYINLDAIKKVSLYTIHINQDNVEVLVPYLRGTDTALFIDNFGKGIIINIPTVTINKKRYIDDQYMGLQVGVNYEKKNKGILLLPINGMEKEQSKVHIKEHIALVFDPFPSLKNPYIKGVAPNATTIISPSWFELTKEGIKSSSSLNSNYVQYYKGIDFEIWPLITNQFNPKLTAEILEDKQSWSHIANMLGSYAIAYGYRGYNFDFENVYYEDKDKLTAFVNYLHKALQPYGVYTSMDVTGYSDSLRWSKVYDRKKLGEHLDYVVLMAYDQVGAGSTVGGPVASYPWVKKNLEQFVQEVPKEKVLLGIPLYMREWKVETTQMDTPKDQTPVILSVHQDTVTRQHSLVKKKNHKEDKKNHRKSLQVITKVNAEENNVQTEKVSLSEKRKSKTLPIDGVDSIFQAYGSHIIWNPELKLYYLEYVVNGENIRIWFENEDSLKMKLALIHDYDIAGFALWRKDFENEKIRNFISMNTVF